MSTFERTIPILVYADITAAHDFLVDAFGFTSGGVHRDDTGNAVHGEVRVGEQTIWLHRVVDEFNLSSPLSMQNVASGLVVIVDDVDAHHERAREHGASVTYEPRNMPYGQREYEARDPEGHRWWFATQIEVETTS